MYIYIIPLILRINLDNNPFTYLPDNVFAAITALGTVSMAGINWECTCNNLWFLDWFSENNILFTSAATCTLPSSHYGETCGGEGWTDLASRLGGWLVGWVVGWLVGWLAGWRVGGFVGCMVG